jgi:hypothetical protein
MQREEKARLSQLIKTNKRSTKFFFRFEWNNWKINWKRGTIFTQRVTVRFIFGHEAYCWASRVVAAPGVGSAHPALRWVHPEQFFNINIFIVVFWFDKLQFNAIQEHLRLNRCLNQNRV